jgi:stage V sporulation protein S
MNGSIYTICGNCINTTITKIVCIDKLLILKMEEAFMSMEILKVSSKSIPNSVAGAIAGVIREKNSVEVQSVGAGALNQAIKAIAVARGYLAPAGMDLVCIPSFTSVTIDGSDRTAIRLVIEPK